ncbi:MAG: cytochrome c maturation protein CcmE [Polyangiaceae bacterium]|nr:cytochrome c maturation protein CcmE [Polyangiaceae bacterium]NUQ73788.1 cytochrome c maturation protein CcmE [Polyangiaceae bacterium]
MSRKLDEELANAIRDTDASAEASPTSESGLVKPAQTKPPPTRSIGLLATLLVLVGAVVSLMMVGFKEAAIYATPVDQLLAEKEKLAGRKVRVEGELVPGTLSKRDQPCEYRFTVHGATKSNEVPVRYAQCVLPDTFRDVPGGGVQVTVEGTLNKEGHFDATLVMAKCTSKYDPSTHQMKDGQLADMPIN